MEFSTLGSLSSNHKLQHFNSKCTFRSLFTLHAVTTAFLHHKCQAHHLLGLFLHLEQGAQILTLSVLLWAELAGEVRSDAKKDKSLLVLRCSLSTQRLNIRWGKEASIESLELLLVDTLKSFMHYLSLLPWLGNFGVTSKWFMRSSKYDRAKWLKQNSYRKTKCLTLY